MQVSTISLSLINNSRYNKSFFNCLDSRGLLNNTKNNVTIFLKSKTLKIMKLNRFF